MGIDGLKFQPFHLPFGGQGVKSKPHPFALDAPALTICRDAYFTQTGALKTRFPYAALGTNILGGGTITNPRRLVANGNELVLFTDTAVYSWSTRDTAWVLRGTHLAVSLNETSVFDTPDDQIDNDRAELAGTIVYAWANGTSVYAAAIDKTTGAVITGPTNLGAGSRPRLVACTTRIMLVWSNSTTLTALAIDPANVATSLATSPTTVVSSATYSAYFDVTQVIGADKIVGACRNQTTTSYTVFTLTSGMTLATASKSRTCDGPIAVSSTPDGVSVQIVRANGTNIQGDLLAISGLGDTFTNQAIGTVAGTPVNQIAAAHRSVTNGGQYRCYVFWDAQEATTPTGWDFKTNWVDTGNSLGTQAQFLTNCGPGSRAFSYNGQVYLWVAFGLASAWAGDGGAGGQLIGQLQNAYFLYRDDGVLSAKSTYSRGGGQPPSTGRLPAVALTAGTTTYSWCATERRKIPIGGGTGTGVVGPGVAFGWRAPRDVTFTFDSNDARHTARLGKTLYVAAGQVSQYDGNGLYEVGHHIAPYYFANALVGGGAIPNGVYAYKWSWRWTNAQGEKDRSTTAVVGNPTMSSGPQSFSLTSIANNPFTNKAGTVPPAALEAWRTAANPDRAAAFYLVTDTDPKNGSGNNRYLTNTVNVALLSFTDNYTDAIATTKENWSEPGATLASLSPPAATVIAASADRLFLAGIAGDPHRIWYSKQRSDGEVAAFNDSLVLNVPQAGGAITALAFLNETLIVFRAGAIYALPGDGFDNTGGGQNYGPAKIISQDVGAVSADAVAFHPLLGLFFKSNKGWYLLDRGWNLKYIGADVNFADGDTVYAIHVLESVNQIRIVTNNRVLVYTHTADQWAEWTIANGVHAAIWQGTYVYLDATQGAMQEQTSYALATYGMDVELAWAKLADAQGFMRIRRPVILTEYRSPVNVRIRWAVNYQADGAGSWNWIDDNTVTFSSGTVGGALQVRHLPSQQLCEAFKCRITLSPPTGQNGDQLTLLALSGEVGFKGGVFKRLPVGNQV